MVYQVIKAFTYAGQEYHIGDTWTPSGHKNDGAIIRARMVIAADTRPTPTRRPRKAGA